MNKRRTKAIAKAYIESGYNGAESGLKVFNTTKRKNASVMMRKALQTKNVQNEIQAQLAKAGIDEEFINTTMYQAIETNKLGKPSQAVLAQLLIQAQKIYNYLPKDNKVIIKQERKILLDKDYKIVKTNLSESVTQSQELLNDLD